MENHGAIYVNHTWHARIAATACGFWWLSQPEFAGFMGVSLGTLRNWEQERRQPHGSARALLLVASKQPAAVRAAFESAKPTTP